jgi:anaerobic selenocysteine-containing dehydrogenase
MPERIHTFCRVCEPSCALVAEVEGGRLVRLEPDRDHPVTRGFACHKGIAGLDIHRDPDRLGHPLRRAANGGFERVGWDAALSEIAQRVLSVRDAHGPDGVGFYLGNPLAFNTLAAPATGSLIAQLGSRRVFSSGTQDCANKFAGAEAVFGTSTLHPIPDIQHTHHLLVFGSNPRVSHMSFLSIPDPMRALREAVRRGAIVRHVNPRRTETSEAGGGETVLIRPDTDVYLMAAMLCELERAGQWRDDVLADHGSHVDGLREFVARYPAERVATVTGIPAGRIRRLAREFGEAPTAAVYMSTGVNMGRQGTLAYWLLFMLSLVTGNLDRRGGNLYSLGFYPAPKAGRTDPERTFFASPWGRIRRIRGALPGNLLADMIEHDGQPLRALIVVAGNPLLSIGGGERLRGALERLDLLVVIDLYRNATAELADFALPATDMFERPDINLCGLGMQQRPFVQYTDRVVPPRDERREEWWILARLEQELGLKSVLDTGDDPPLWTRTDHMLARSGLSIEALRAAPHGTALLPPVEPGRFYADWVQTPDGRVDCRPALFDEAIARAEVLFQELAAEPEGGLRLISRRDDHMHNSWYQNLPGLKRGRWQRNPLGIHPDDARARGIRAGDRVRVWNDAGSVEAEAELDDSLLRGVVAMTHGWGNERTPGMRTAQRHPGVNANALLPSGPGSFEPVSNQAFMTGIPVRVSPAGGESGEATR